jgi:hypothetical protein
MAKTKKNNPRARFTDPDGRGTDDYLYSNFEIITTPNAGRSVIALRDFLPDELVMRIYGRLIPDTKRSPYGSHYCMELDDHRMILEPYMPGGLVNHSCSPNCIQNTNPNIPHCWELRALCFIATGQELCYDYGWPFQGEFPKCHCGSYNCRGYIVSEEDLPKLLAAKRRKKAKRR